MANTHEFIAAKETDSRSPCPALNSLANHGHLPRDGKNVTAMQLVSALTGVYKISYPFAIALSLGGIALCGHGFTLDLEGLCQHNKIEHDASMAHRDIDETGSATAVNKPDHALIQAIIDSSDGQKVTLDNLVKIKFERELRANIKSDYASGTLKLFSHGEPVLATEVLQRGGPGIPVEWFRAWFEEERLPDGLAPPNTTGIISVHAKSTGVNNKLAALHAEAAKTRRDA